MEILARLANRNEKLPEKQYKKVESEVGNVFLPSNGMEYSDTVSFGFSKFLWMPRITVDGVSLS